MSRSINTDTAIVGAGPGGSAAALYLSRRGVRSVIVEKDSFPRYHIGESLTGEVGQRIRDLGLGEYMDEAKHPIKHGVNVYGPHGRHTFTVPTMMRTDSNLLQPTSTWQVPRDQFDQRMLDHALEAGAEYLQGKASALVTIDDAVRGIEVTLPDGELIRVNSKVVLDASGPASFLHGAGVTSRKQRGGYDKQVAIYSQLSGGIRNPGSEPDNTLILYKSKNHWAWFIPLSETSVSVGVVVPSEYYKTSGEDLATFFRREVHEVNPELKRRLPRLDLLEPVRASSNYSYAIDSFVGNGFLCVGDSHRFIDPVFSFGLHLAVHEAEMAAEAIAKHLESGSAMGSDTFKDYERTCTRGMDTIQDLIDAFWNNPHAFSHAAHVKYRDDIIDLFAGRIYRENPSPGLKALRAINDKYRAPAL